MAKSFRPLERTGRSSDFCKHEDCNCYDGGMTSEGFICPWILINSHYYKILYVFIKPETVMWLNVHVSLHVFDRMFMWYAECINVMLVCRNMDEDRFLWISVWWWNFEPIGSVSIMKSVLLQQRQNTNYDEKWDNDELGLVVYGACYSYTQMTAV